MNLLAADLGKITPPAGSVPTTGGNPSGFVASIVQNSIWLLIVTSFIIAVIWMIFAGLGFIFAGDDPKKISGSWTKIYMGLLGLVIIVGAFAIIKLVEAFFNVTIISGSITLPVITK